jgi:hypothetical protein
LEDIIAAPVNIAVNTAVGMRCVDHATLSISKRTHWVLWQAAAVRSV